MLSTIIVAALSVYVLVKSRVAIKVMENRIAFTSASIKSIQNNKLEISREINKYGIHNNFKKMENTNWDDILLFHGCRAYKKGESNLCIERPKSYGYTEDDKVIGLFSVSPDNETIRLVGVCDSCDNNQIREFNIKMDSISKLYNMRKYWLN
ncbi:hypothetical protein EU556_21510 [Hymenobacter fodinae]|uniref:Uncharacterized protein n=2 Tax=Hymenobacter fodinae TaxID=2510796 RepID=A0A4Z0P1G6_9BACT|nr:hypothetical protein EU556_21510 [Hymenobacter fodinae]